MANYLTVQYPGSFIGKIRVYLTPPHSDININKVIQRKYLAVRIMPDSQLCKFCHKTHLSSKVLSNTYRNVTQVVIKKTTQNNINFHRRNRQHLKT